MPVTCEPCCARDDADVDDLVLAVGLHDERHALGNGRGRIVDAEISDVEVHLVVGHCGLVGEARVLVRVDPDLIALRVPEHRENAAAAGRVTVAVDVGAHLAAQARVALVEQADAIGAVGGRRVGHAVEHEGRAAHLCRHVDPRGIVVGERIRARHPVDDLAFTGRGGQQRRVIERHARVDDADRDATTVVRRVRVHELGRANVLRRHVRVDSRRGGTGCRLRDQGRGALGARIWNLQHLVQVDVLHRWQCGHRLDERRVDRHAQVADRVLTEQDAPAERGNHRRGGRRLPRHRGDEQRADPLVPVARCLELLLGGQAELAAAIVVRRPRRVGLLQADPEQYGAEADREGRRELASHAWLLPCCSIGRLVAVARRWHVSCAGPGGCRHRGIRRVGETRWHISKSLLSRIPKRSYRIGSFGCQRASLFLGPVGRLRRIRDARA